MAKTRSPEYEAVAVAWRQPAKSSHVSRRSCWGGGRWPCRWGWFLNRHILSLSIGEPREKFYGSDVPESRFLFSLDIRPFSIIVFWNRRRVLWMGDWEWKKSLSCA